MADFDTTFGNHMEDLSGRFESIEERLAAAEAALEKLHELIPTVCSGCLLKSCACSVPCADRLTEREVGLMEARDRAIDGPQGWVIVHSDGRFELDYFHITDTWTVDGDYVSMEEWRQAYRPDCQIVKGRVVLV